MGNTGKERATRAFQAMEELGLERKSITPILRELLKVYNNEWSYIEAENYRLLADQAFEQQEIVVNPDAPPSPRQTRASSSATSSAAEKGKKHIECRDTRSPEKRPPNAVAQSSVGAGRGASKPPLLAQVKVEKEADGTPETRVRTSVVGRVETRAMREKHENLRSNGDKLGLLSRSSVPVAPSITIDAQTLEETLRLIASTSTDVCAETRSTGVANCTHQTVSPLEEKTCSPTKTDNGGVEQSLEKLETVCESATQFRGPDSCITKATTGLNVIDRSAPELDSDKVREAGSVIVEQPSCPRVVEEKSRWHKPVNDGANVLLLLADNYSEDEDQPKVAELAVPDSTITQPTAEEVHNEPLRVQAAEPDSSAMQLSVEAGQEQLMQSIEIELPEEDLPEQPLDMVLSVEDEPEHLDPLEADSAPEHALGTAERIRPRFIVNKEVPVAAYENVKPISSLLRHEVESTSSVSKRELPNPQALTQVKRIKYDTEPEDSTKLSNGIVVPHEGGVNSCHVTEDKEKCPTSPGTSRRNLIRAASPDPSSSRKKSKVGDTATAGTNRRKLIVSESTSPEASPVLKVHATNGVAESMKASAGLTSAEVVEVEMAASATAVVHTTMEPEFDDEDEPHDSKKKLAHLPADISRGTERISIPYVNDYNSDTIPASFKYIPVNTLFQDAYVNFSLARIGEDDCCGGCSGDCLQAPYPCTCTRETGGVFAYTKEGLLKDEFLQHEVDSLQNEEIKVKLVTFCQSGWECPIERAKNFSIPENCKGHLSRKFIKECWHKCGCSMDCGNRVVQRGITRQLQIFFTQEGKGWGLRTLEQLPPGAFVCEYVGEILTNIELDKRNSAQKGESTGTHTYPILLDGDWCSEKGLKDEEALCLDATYFGNAARFINHRCLDANLIDMPVTIESPDRHYYHVAFFTSRTVKAMEELTWDYKIDFDDDEHPIEAFQCCCNSPFCRGSSGKKKRKLVKKFSY